jgi:D-glycero-D-manno-heptose 1,7-bisphosphate phosphatase
VLEGNNRVVLLDRDGVLNVDRPGSVTSLAELELEPGAAAGTALLAASGYRLLVVTNQACVGRGQLDRATLDEIDAELDRRLGHVISEFFVCPHSAEDACACRKPRPGLLESARAAWGFDPAVTWLVGDDGRDVEAARAFGCRPALLRTGKGSLARDHHPDVPLWDDLYTFARWLTKETDASRLSDAR